VGSGLLFKMRRSALLLPFTAASVVASAEFSPVLLLAGARTHDILPQTGTGVLPLGTASEVDVWKVPLPRGNLKPAAYVASCASFGLKPVCEGGHDCFRADSQCLALAIEEQHCGAAMDGLGEALNKGGVNPDQDPFFKNVCNYMKPGVGWDSGFCGGPGTPCGNDAAGAQEELRYTLCAGKVDLEFGLRSRIVKVEEMTASIQRSQEQLSHDLAALRSETPDDSLNQSVSMLASEVKGDRARIEAFAGAEKNLWANAVAVAPKEGIETLEFAPSGSSGVSPEAENAATITSLRTTIKVLHRDEAETKAQLQCVGVGAVGVLCLVVVLSLVRPRLGSRRSPCLSTRPQMHDCCVKHCLDEALLEEYRSNRQISTFPLRLASSLCIAGSGEIIQDERVRCL